MVYVFTAEYLQMDMLRQNKDTKGEGGNRKVKTGSNLLVVTGNDLLEMTSIICLTLRYPTVSLMIEALSSVDTTVWGIGS